MPPAALRLHCRRNKDAALAIPPPPGGQDAAFPAVALCFHCRCDQDTAIILCFHSLRDHGTAFCPAFPSSTGVTETPPMPRGHAAPAALPGWAYDPAPPAGSSSLDAPPIVQARPTPLPAAAATAAAAAAATTERSLALTLWYHANFHTLVPTRAVSRPEADRRSVPCRLCVGGTAGPKRRHACRADRADRLSSAQGEQLRLACGVELLVRSQTNVWRPAVVVAVRPRTDPAAGPPDNDDDDDGGGGGGGAGDGELAAGAGAGPVAAAEEEEEAAALVGGEGGLGGVWLRLHFEGFDPRWDEW